MAKRDVDIQELLVWAYKDQCVDEAPRGIMGPRIARMRFDVAGDGNGIAPEDIHPDAFTLAAAVRKLSRRQSEIVEGCAKVDCEPECYPGARPVMAAVLNGHGNPAALFDRAGHVIGHRVRPALELIDGTILCGCDDEYLAAVRSRYSAWREALVALVADLKGQLSDHNAIGPSAPSRPWEIGYRAKVA